MITLTKLNDVFEDWLTGDGIFTDLNAFSVPWKTGEETDADLIKNLNMAYHGSHSGDKNISPIVHKFLTSEDAETRTKLAGIIYTMFGDKWSKLWDAFNTEYNPLNNYDMVETETPAETTHTITPAETTETITPAETTMETKPAKVVTENEISAFNSSGYEDSAKTTAAGDVNDKGTDVFTVDESGVNKIEVDAAGTDVFTVQNERTLTRSGNIGVTSSQQLLQSEIELRKWLYFNSVFNDIDTILTLSIY